ncbi:MAG: hypothetical protein ACREXO_07595 [Advenella sp.]
MNAPSAKSVGEVGLVGTAAAIANTIFHATENVTMNCLLRKIRYGMRNNKVNKNRVVCSMQAAK